LLVELDSLEQDLDEEEGKEEEGKASKYQPWRYWEECWMNERMQGDYRKGCANLR
jgi:hypothetical protein